MTNRHDSDPRDVASAYRAANDALGERPSAATRATIIAAAARAAGARPHGAGRSPRWRTPLAAAATVLIGTIAVLLAQRIEHELPAAIEEKRAEVAMPLPPTEVPSTDTRAAAPAAPAAAPERRAQSPSTERRERPAARDRSQPPAPARAPEAQRETMADAATSQALGKVAAPSEAKEAAVPPVAAAAKPAAPAAGALLSRERRAEAGAEAPMASASAAPESPERWLARIIDLRRAGRDDEADAELKKLRERHPELTIPAAALRATGTR